MKCYTINVDRVVLGIQPVEVDGRLGVINGHGDRRSILYLDENWSASLKELAAAEAEMEGKKPVGMWRISNADISDDGSALIPKPTNEAAASALVLVQSDIPEEYRVTANCYYEEWDLKREAVIRHYLPLDHAAGIDVAKEHPTCPLLIMGRGSSFRIAVDVNRRTQYFAYQWRDWKWPKLERIVPPLRRVTQEAA